MAIPHKTAAFSNLSKVVNLPAPKAVETVDPEGGERRRRRRG
jgi:hypothetical protein